MCSKWMKDVDFYVAAASTTETTQPQGFNLYNLLGPFIILLSGLSMSIVAFIFEIILNKIKPLNKNTARK